MFLYNSSDNTHNLLIQQLWLELEKSGDLQQMFYANEQTSSFALMTLLAAPRWSFFDVDDKGIWMLVWFNQWLNSAWMGLWCREDMRHKMKFSKNLFTVMSEAFRFFPVIMGVTKRADLLEIHKKLGYNVSLIVPELYGDSPGWLVSLHKNNFKHLKEPETDG
jgi:hypothetical protein